MPGLDRTGPIGDGPQTGRKKGKCRSEQNAVKQTMLKSDKTETPFGRGKGCGEGRRKRNGAGGRGFGRGPGRNNS